MQLLHHRSSHSIRVLAFNHDCPARPIDNLLHQHVPPFISRFHGLPNVLVPEVPEHILHQILKLKARQVI